MNTPNNPFWLEVKKEYVTDRDNFDRLIAYLKWYSLNSDELQNDNDSDSDFNRTFVVLQEAAIDSLNVLCANKLIGQICKSTWDEMSFDARVVAAYLLTCKIKGKTDWKVLARLADVLVLSGFAVTHELLMKLRKVILCCASNNEIKSYGFSWNDIQGWDKISANIFCNHLGNTTFLVNESSFYYEGKGLLIIKDDSLTLSPFNWQQYNDYTKAGKLTCQLSIEESNLHIETTKREKKSTNSFEDLEELSNDLLLQQRTVKPSQPVKLKNYEEGDELVVKITDYYQYGFIAESVDPTYNKVFGQVYIDSKFKMKYLLGIDDFKRYIKPGTCLLVSKQARINFPFALNDEVFSDYYKVVIQNCDRLSIAVYKGDYSAGYQWTTIDGVTVNVYGKDVDQMVIDAKEKGLPIKVEIFETKNDKNGNLIANGNYLNYDEIQEFDSKDIFLEKVRKKMIAGFIDYSHDYYLPTSNADIEDMAMLPDDCYISILSHIYYYLSFQGMGIKKRYSQLIASFFLSVLCNTEGVDYIKLEMDYLSLLVKFAKGDDPNLLSLVPKDTMMDNPTVISKIRTLELLNKYSITGNDFSTIEVNLMSDEAKYSILRQLVIASNVLIGKTSLSEINRIKKSIAKFLGVEDEYKNILPDLTYYGEESDTLEFKSSAVFSPNSNLAEPNEQIWAILKTVCGFMNTLSGGELLLGVKDNGNSLGLDKDIEYLYNNGKITNANIDKYRDYIKRKVDKSFVDDSGIAKGINITSGRIFYIIEKNKEEHTILRIQVRPYEYGNVVFNPDIERPNNVAYSYYRTSGATVPMDDELKRKAKDRKVNASYDGNLRKFILLQKACYEKKRVQLINYTSHSGTSDKYIEPFKALPEHGAFLCYDIDKKEIREYKLSRMENVSILNEKWMYANKHKANIHIDIFGMIEDQKEKPYEVVLKLKPLAYNLLKEEYKDSSKYISENLDTTDKDDYPWVLQTLICKSEGIGRFYIGLAGSIKIVNGEKLREYIRRYKDNYLSNF